MNKKSLRGSLLLLLGSVIWGAAFVAQRVGMDHMGPFFFNGIRMLLAGVVMIPVTVLIERKNARRDELQHVDPKDQRRAGLLCGFMLFAASSLQQMGLVTTTAGKAGFITALYVVLVPVAAWLLFKKNPGRIIWLGVALAVFALYLLCMPAGGFSLQSGDLLLLGCAACYTVQILCVDYYAPKVSGVRLARDEFLITGALSMLIALFTETITIEGIREALIPILYSGIMSGAVGFTLQIIGQRDTDPTIASLLMCLESVFAVLTGAIVLGEKMTVRETAGCILMFSAVILAQLSPVISSLRRGGRFRR
jgi:drug/metabolite transporter (DMT)-like permease